MERSTPLHFFLKGVLPPKGVKNNIKKISVLVARFSERVILYV